MLPFDTKSEFPVIVDTADGTPLSQTQAAAEQLATLAMEQPEVLNVQTYAGVASLFNFNGLVHPCYVRRGPQVADI
jgi:multidrug efflux pump subunit AcrB